ncbi:MAG: RtcB family protein, partial [Syntrophales bacterium LBB04]|nr:RtcB family protein [Syntrophales bacterium LBB04]
GGANEGNAADDALMVDQGGTSPIDTQGKLLYASRHKKGSSAHPQAIKPSKGRSIRKEMSERGIIVMENAKATLSEAMPAVYKNIDEAVNGVHYADLSRRVAKLRAVRCVKG